MVTWSHDEPYSVQIIFFRFIISSIVTNGLENPEKVSKIIILRRIVNVIHQAPDFGRSSAHQVLYDYVWHALGAQGGCSQCKGERV